jgi:hypothetical protein
VALERRAGAAPEPHAVRRDDAGPEAADADADAVS